MFRKEAFLKLSLTSVIGQLITFICLPVITRIYTPEEYGRYYLALIIVSILLPVVTMKLDIALMVNKNKALVIDLSKRLITVVSLGVISTFIVTAVLALALDNIDTKALFFMSFVGLLLILNTISILASAIALRENMVDRLGKSSILQSSFVNAFQVSIGQLYSNYSSLIIGYLIGRFSSAYFLMRAEINTKKIFIVNKKTKLMPFINSNRFLILFGLAESLLVNFPFLWMAIFRDSVTVGSLGMAQTLAAAPALMISGSLLSSIVAYAQSPRTALSMNVTLEHVWKVTKKMIYFYPALTLLQVVTFEVILKRVISDNWTLTLETLVIFSAISLLQIIVSPIVAFLILNQDWKFYSFSLLATFTLASIVFIYLVQGSRINVGDSVAVYGLARYIVLFFILATWMLQSRNKLCRGHLR